MEKRVLSQVWIYPIKSLGGIRVESAEVLPKGLQYDRRWMLIDERGKFMTQRNVPAMARFKLKLEKSALRVTHEYDSLDVPLKAQVAGKEIQATVWKDAVSVQDLGESFHRWFTDRLGIPCRLVAFPEANPRPVDPSYRIAEDSVSLADGYPILIIGQSSLDDLNSRLDRAVPMNRFRPNLVFTGGLPYEEDNWREFRIGDSVLAGVKPCSRCVLTTVDQETGEVGKEPLLTLSRYRKKDHEIYFGQNVIPVDGREIHEGDEIVLR